MERTLYREICSACGYYPSYKNSDYCLSCLRKFRAENKRLLRSEYRDYRYYADAEYRKKHLEYQKEYNQRPEVAAYLKEYRREYSQRPEVAAYLKEYRREYSQRPEVAAHRKEQKREYNQRPEVVARLKERQSTPEYIAYRRAYYMKNRKKKRLD